MAWLNRHYSEAIEAWVERIWLADITDEQRAGIASADAKIRSIHDINLLEYLLSEASFDDVEGKPKALSLVLAADELALDEAQRDYLQQLPTRPLQLYQVVACQAGQSFSVRDVLDEKAEAFQIDDSYGSRMFEAGDVVGLRLLQTPAGTETSGAIYHIPEAYVQALIAELKEADAQARTLISYWLKLVAAHV